MRRFVRSLLVAVALAMVTMCATHAISSSVNSRSESSYGFGLQGVGTASLLNLHTAIQSALDPAKRFITAIVSGKEDPLRGRAANRANYVVHIGFADSLPRRLPRPNDRLEIQAWQPHAPAGQGQMHLAAWLWWSPSPRAC